MISNKTVDSPVLSTCFSVACLALKTSYEKHALAYRINWDTKRPYAGDEGILKYKLQGPKYHVFTFYP